MEKRVRLPANWAMPCEVLVWLPVEGELELAQDVEIGPELIPKGFKTDLASVPRIFWAILPPFGKYRMAALLHDYYYRHQTISRLEADNRFVLMMRAYEVAAWKRGAMWLALRVGGWLPWRKQARVLEDG